MADRCPRCDREGCKAVGIDPEKAARAWVHSTFGKAADEYGAVLDCRAHAVDWRARCLAAESRLLVLEVVVEAARLRLLDINTEHGGFLDGVCLDCDRSDGHDEGCETGANCEVLDQIDRALAALPTAGTPTATTDTKENDHG